MKKLYLLFTLTLLCFFSRAQISVTATAGTTGPTLYTTLQQAAEAVNTGIHQGAVSISITANSTETVGSVFIKSGSGGASYTAVTIRPAAGVAATITADVPGPLINLAAASNISIDGLNSGGSSLTFINNSTGTSASCVTFTGGASSNELKNCTFLGASASNTSGVIVFTAAGATGNSNNKLQNNNIGDAPAGTPANGVYSLGTAGLGNDLNELSDNNIYNYFQPAVLTTGIFLGANSSSWRLERNHLYQATARVFTAGFIHRAIWIADGTGSTLYNNIIGGSASDGSGLYELSGSATRFTGIEINTTASLAPDLRGNQVQNIQITTTSGAGAPQGIFCGIYITGGNANVGTGGGNIIGAPNGNGSIRIIPSTGGGVVTGITYNGPGVINVQNNTVGSIDLLPTGVLSGNAFALQVVGSGATMTIRNNTLGGNTANSIRVGVKGTTTGNGLIRGIFTNNNGTMDIGNNLIQNLTHNSSNALALFRAIECQVGTVSITGNTINNIAAEGTSVNTATHEGIGILVSTSVPNIVIDNNTLSNLSLTNSGAIGTILSGIYIGSLNTGASITRNKLYGFSNAATGLSTTTPPVASGIYLRDVASGELFVANNMISLGSSQTTNTSFIGIWNQVNPASSYTEKLYYNSVNIEGVAATGSQPSFAFYRGNFSTTAFTGPTMDIKNNIFINSRTGETANHYAIANGFGAAISSASGWPAGASDYNVLKGSTLGYWSGNQDFAGWKAASSSDNNSLNNVVVTFVNAASDLHLVSNANAAIEGRAIPLASVPNDIDGDPRDAALPDIGADEVLNVVPVRIEFFRGQKQPGKNLLEWKVNTSNTFVKFVIERSNDGRNFSAAGNMTAGSFTQVFSFYDASPLAGINYYRLKMVEDNGNISYSATISLLSEIKDVSLSIRPNYITGGVANFYIQSEKATQATVVVTDASGKMVLQKMMNIPAGAGIYPLNVSVLSKGVYQLTLHGNGWLNTERVVIW